MQLNYIILERFSGMTFTSVTKKRQLANLAVERLVMRSLVLVMKHVYSIMTAVLTMNMLAPQFKGQKTLQLSWPSE